MTNKKLNYKTFEWHNKNQKVANSVRKSNAKIWQKIERKNLAKNHKMDLLIKAEKSGIKIRTKENTKLSMDCVKMFGVCFYCVNVGWCVCVCLLIS